MMAMAALVVQAAQAVQADPVVPVDPVVLDSADPRLTFSIMREIRKKSKTSSVRRFVMETTSRRINFSYAPGKLSNPLCQPSSRLNWLRAMPSKPAPKPSSFRQTAKPN